MNNTRLYIKSDYVYQCFPEGVDFLLIQALVTALMMVAT